MCLDYDILSQSQENLYVKCSLTLHVGKKWEETIVDRTLCWRQVYLERKTIASHHNVEACDPNEAGTPRVSLNIYHISTGRHARLQTLRTVYTRIHHGHLPGVVLVLVHFFGGKVKRYTMVRYT